MRVHTKLNIKNMVGVEAYLALYFEKQNGDKLYSDNDKFRSKGGQTAVYRSFNPPYRIERLQRCRRVHSLRRI